MEFADDQAMGAVPPPADDEEPELRWFRQKPSKGDWKCPTPRCGGLNWRRKTACYLCGAAKPEHEDPKTPREQRAQPRGEKRPRQELCASPWSPRSLADGSPAEPAVPAKRRKKEEQEV